ncbi:MAG: efflux RND transporter periplasmic adaptor subunit, partial [Bacteroidota bacterium]
MKVDQQIGRWIVTVGLGLVWLLTIKCSSAGSEGASDAGGSIIPPPALVDTARVSSGILIQDLKVAGEVFSRRQVDLTFEQGGRLQTHSLAAGKRVKKGAILATLDDEIHQLRLKRAELDLMEAEHNKQILLIEHGYDSLPPPKNKARSFDIQSGYLRARVALEEAQYHVRQCTLRAPYSGTIATVEVQPKQMITPGESLATLTAQGSLWIRTQVLPQELSGLRLGINANVQVPSLPSDTLVATLQEINPEVNEEGLVSVNLKLKGDPERVYPGMYTQVQMQLPGQREYCLVPPAAVLEREGKSVLLVYQDGRA